MRYAANLQPGDKIIWPNGTESRISAIDHDADELMDSTGTWHRAYDVDRAIEERAA